MKILNSKLFRILALVIVVGVLLNQTNVLANLFHPNRVSAAVGDLTVTWEGQGAGNSVGPIFEVENIVPGDSDSKTITVLNNATTPTPIALRGLKTNGGILDQALLIEISENGTILYGDNGTKTLNDFFTESQGSQGITLGTLNPGQQKTYTVGVFFDTNAGNEYQNQTLVFSLIVGIDIEIPEACEALGINVFSPIYGTEKADRIDGTNGNDLIYALGGADHVEGKNGNDCIIAGGGTDRVAGGGGDDVIFGDEGSDRLEGDGGNDILFGGNGPDTLEGGNGDDKLYGENGSDAARGGGGTDTCVAESKSSCEL